MPSAKVMEPLSPKDIDPDKRVDILQTAKAYEALRHQPLDPGSEKYAEVTMELARLIQIDELLRRGNKLELLLRWGLSEDQARKELKRINER